MYYTDYYVLKIGLIHDTMQINLEYIMLSQRGQRQKVILYDYIYMRYPD